MPRQNEKTDMARRNQEMVYRLADAFAKEPGVDPSAALQAAGMFAVAAAFCDICAAVREAIDYAKEEEPAEATKAAA